MKRKLFIWSLTVCFLLSATTHSSSQTTDKIPDFPVKKGISAPLAGFIGDWLIVGGGCNFPTIPAAEGGSKAYYAQCYALDTQASTPQWISLPDLPQPMAYNCTVETSHGLVCIGGLNSDSCLTQVFRIERNCSTGNFTYHTLPSLPETIDNASATILNECIFVTGGNQQHGKNSLYKLDLKNKGTWQKLASFPGPHRIQPILVHDNRFLYLIGGFQSPAPQKESILSEDILQYDPKTNRWQHETLLPHETTGEKRCMAGGSGTQLSNTLILTGGVNYNLFKKAIEGKAGSDYLTHEPEWYKFNDDLLFFDTQKKKWTIHPNVPGMARAGGILLYHQKSLYMVCGEIKQGIRTPKITVYPLKKEKDFSK